MKNKKYRRKKKNNNNNNNNNLTKNEDILLFKKEVEKQLEQLIEPHPTTTKEKVLLFFSFLAFFGAWISPLYTSQNVIINDGGSSDYGRRGGGNDNSLYLSLSNNEKRWFETEGRASLKGVAITCLVLIIYNRGARAKGNAYLMIGLIANSIGDILLEYNESVLFSMGPYMIGNMLIIFTLLESVFSPISGGLFLSPLRIAACITPWPLFISFTWITWPYYMKQSPDLLFPIICYMLLVTIMVSVAAVPPDIENKMRYSMGFLALSEVIRAISILEHVPNKKQLDYIIWPISYWSQVALVLAVVHYRLPIESYKRFKEYLIQMEWNIEKDVKDIVKQN